VSTTRHSTRRRVGAREGVPARKRLSAEQRRAAILDAALEVFAGRGYHASSIDDIASAAGISKALIYEHFRSKEDLHLELLQANAAELFERLAAAVPAAEPGEARLRAGLEAFFAFVAERRDAWRMLFRESADAEMSAALDRVVEQVTAMVAGLIAAEPVEGPREGEAERQRSIRMLAQMLVGAVQSLANWWSDHQEVPRERMVERVMDFAWVGLERLRAGERWSA
jgi:AcrR family transcriptional regulator